MHLFLDLRMGTSSDAQDARVVTNPRRRQEQLQDARGGVDGISFEHGDDKSEGERQKDEDRMTGGRRRSFGVGWVEFRESKEKQAWEERCRVMWCVVGGNGELVMWCGRSEAGESATSCVLGGLYSSSSASKSTTLGGSESSSIIYFPLGHSTVAAAMRASCARRYSFSFPGKGGYDRTGASRSPVKNLRMRAAATS